MTPTASKTSDTSAVTESLRNLYSKEYAYVCEYQKWAAQPVYDLNDWDEPELVPTNLRKSTWWRAEMPFSEQVTLALRLGYYEALLTNTIDKTRFEVSSYYRLGQILGTMAAKGTIPHSSWKDIVWAVDDLTGFNRSLPLGTETLKVAKQIANQINTQKEQEPVLA